jgi:hypothetical protein
MMAVVKAVLLDTFLRWNAFYCDIGGPWFLLGWGHGFSWIKTGFSSIYLSVFVEKKRLKNPFFTRWTASIKT